MAVITQRLRSQPTLKVIHHRNENAVDITAKGIDKHSTLRKIIGGQDYVAFGNDANDVEMLEHAKQGYYVLSYEDEVDPKALGLQTVQPTTKAIVETLLQLNEQYTK